MSAVGVDLSSLPAIPQDQEGPVFRAPWEAQAFALVLRLHEQGVFSWQEWADTLAGEIQAAQGAGDADLGDTYYQHWLNALETLALARGLTDRSELSTRRDAWAQAYRDTPHGQPVMLTKS